MENSENIQPSPVYCFDIVDKVYYPISTNKLKKQKSKEEEIEFEPDPFNSIYHCLSYFKSAGISRFDPKDKWQKRNFIMKYIKGETKLKNRFVMAFDLDELLNKVENTLMENQLKNIESGITFYIYNIHKNTELKFFTIQKALDFIKKVKGEFSTEAGIMFGLAKKYSKLNNVPVLYDDDLAISYTQVNIKEYDLDKMKDIREDLRNQTVQTMFTANSKYIWQKNSWKEEWSINLKENIESFI